jgi:hypothetical protein
MDVPMPKMSSLTQEPQFCAFKILQAEIDGTIQI